MADYILQELPIQQEDGTKKVYPRMQVYSRFDYEKVLERMTAYPGSPGKGALMSAFSTLNQMLISTLPEGHTIKIDGIGTFSLSLEFDDEKPNELVNKDDAMTHRHVKIKDINFRADPNLLKALNKETNFVRTEAGVRSLAQPRKNLEERIRKAIEHIEKHGFLSITDYVRLTGLSRSSASKELRSFEADPDVPIKGSGQPPHKVWVKSY